MSRHAATQRVLNRIIGGSASRRIRYAVRYSPPIAAVASSENAAWSPAIAPYHQIALHAFTLRAATVVTALHGMGSTL